MSTLTAGRAADLAAATPAKRDRYVDLLRAFSIGVVVFGHWLMAIIYMEGGRLFGANALDTIPGLWLATWVLQVMPLFFFVGGFSHFVSWRSHVERGGTASEFLAGRVRRLMKPTIAFVGAWSGAVVVAEAIQPGLLGSVGIGLSLLAKPLWFLAVYMLVVAAAPTMVALHRRFGVRVLLTLAMGAAVVDGLRFATGIETIGYLNFALVWLFAHQLGFFYADGSLTARSRKFFGAMVGAGLAALVALTVAGPYSPSMVGMATEKASNNSPPSVCLLALTVWLVGAAMLLRPRISAALQRPAVWKPVVVANSMIMTVFLWHLTALLVAVVVLYPLGFPQPEGGSAAWWAWRPLWLAALCLFLAPFVAVFSRVERAALFAPAGGSIGPGRAGLGVAALVAGLAFLAQWGFDSAAAPRFAHPLLSAGIVFAGYTALTARDDKKEV